MTENDTIQVPQPTSPFVQIEEELNRDEEYSQCWLYSKAEIIAVLRSLIQKRVLITVHFDQGNTFFLTSIISLASDNTTFTIDVSNNKEINDKALAADRFIFTAVADKIKVRFTLKQLTMTKVDGLPAFLGSVPDQLLRLQRREFFRLSTPVVHPVCLHATIKNTEYGPQTIDTPLLDISGGGIGFMVAQEKANFFQRGETLPDCKIELPDEGSLTVALSIRSMFDVATRNGMNHIRIGCKFVDLPDARLTVIQRYITRVERERKARLNGLS